MKDSKFSSPALSPHFSTLLWSQRYLVVPSDNKVMAVIAPVDFLSTQGSKLHFNTFFV